MSAFPKPVKIKKAPKRIPRGKRPKRVRRTTNGQLVAKADKMFSLWIRTRDGWRCRLCGSIDRVQCAHLFSRRYRSTRWDPRNAWALCCKCHKRYTHRALEWDDLLRERLGEEEYCRLRKDALVVFSGELTKLLESFSGSANVNSPTSPNETATA